MHSFQGFQREKRAGKALYPGSFSNPRPFWDGGLKPKNVANTNVVYWAGRLLALWEGGQPTKLDPLSLGTAGPTDLLGSVPPGKSFTAHPRLDAATGKIVAFSYQPNPITGTTLRFMEYDEEIKLTKEISEHTVSLAARSFTYIPLELVYLRGHRAPTRLTVIVLS